MMIHDYQSMIINEFLILNNWRKLDYDPSECWLSVDNLKENIDAILTNKTWWECHLFTLNINDQSGSLKNMINTIPTASKPVYLNNELHTKYLIYIGHLMRANMFLWP